MLYHYTDRVSAGEIRRSGLIKASPATLHERLTMDGKTYITEPIVWLTINPIWDGTVLAGLIVAGATTPVANLCRIVLPDLYAGDIGLWEYTQAKGIDPEWWRWAIYTGGLAGSDYTTWRLVDRDIPACDWLGVEVLTAMGPDGLRWTTMTEGVAT